MSSGWCRQTEELIKSKHQDGHILLLILYLDEVHLNGEAHNKLDQVMCTTGNFSDELIYKDIAKCGIGYLPTHIDLKAGLEEHLLAIYESKNRLVKEWQRFELLVERKFCESTRPGNEASILACLHEVGEGVVPERVPFDRDRLKCNIKKILPFVENIRKKLSAEQDMIKFLRREKGFYFPLWGLCDLPPCKRARDDTTGRFSSPKCLWKAQVQEA